MLFHLKIYILQPNALTNSVRLSQDGLMELCSSIRRAHNKRETFFGGHEIEYAYL